MMFGAPTRPNSWQGPSKDNAICIYCEEFITMEQDVGWIDIEGILTCPSRMDLEPHDPSVYRGSR